MTDLSRRAMCAGLTTGVGVASALPPRSFASTGAFKWGDDAARLNTIVRMIGRTDGGVGIRWTDGVLAGVVDQVTTQLLGVSQQIYTRFVAQEDGSYDVVYLELVYFTELQSGQVLEAWNNPYTGRRTDVPVQILGPVRFYLPTDLRVVNEPYPIDGIENAHWFEPLPPTGDDVLFSERIDSYVPPMTADGSPMRFHEVFSFRASAKDLAVTDAPYVPTTIDKVNVISWRTWMDMAEIEGVTMSRGAGRAIVDYDELPDDLIKKNERHFPDVIADIDAYLEM